jgi:hypothetical protein
VYEVKYSHPAFPRDEEIELPGLGLVQNGGTLKVTEEQERLLVSTVGMSLKDYFKDNAMVEVKGTSELKGSDK